jgi:hypothetical protein
MWAGACTAALPFAAALQTCLITRHSYTHGCTTSDCLLACLSPLLTYRPVYVYTLVLHLAELLLSTPPSIPARHQSYGYEPGPGNSLVMQPPPAPAAAGSARPAGTAGAAANNSPSTISNSSRLRSPGRPSTVPNSRGATSAGTAAGGRSSSARSPLREPTRQLQQQLQAVQQPSPVLQQLAGSVSPR